MLYAKWTANTYAVTLDRQDGSGGTASVTPTYGGAMPSITPPTRAGYTFGGYYTVANGGGTQYYTASGTSARNWDKATATTLYAKWTANTYAVTLNRQSGSGGSASVTVTYGSAMPTITVPTRTGYTFGGYYTAANGGGTQYYTASGASAHVWDKAAATTLYAKWTANIYSITFDANGGEGGTSADLAYGSALVAPVATKTGHTFAGWLPEVPATVSAGDATYTAQWTANTYAVTLDQQSGTGGTASVTVTYGSALPEITIPTRTGYTFGGYYTEPNGQGTQYYTASGASACNWDKTSAMTLYAYWISEQPYVEMAVYRMLSPYTGEYLYSGVEVEIEAMVAAGWIREGVVFWALSQPYGGAIPLYRLISPVTGLHLYSSNELEKDILVAYYGWVYEGVAFYVDASADGELSDSRPIYRAASIYGHHLFTSNDVERKFLEDHPEWTVEGVAFWASSPMRSVSLVNPIDGSEYTFEAAYNEPLPDIVPPSQPGLAFGGYLLDCELDDDGTDRLEEMVYDESGHTTWDCFGDMTLHAVWEEEP